MVKWELGCVWTSILNLERAIMTVDISYRPICGRSSESLTGGFTGAVRL
jgi:hypothetical protein